MSEEMIWALALIIFLVLFSIFLYLVALAIVYVMAVFGYKVGIWFGFSIEIILFFVGFVFKRGGKE